MSGKSSWGLVLVGLHPVRGLLRSCGRCSRTLVHCRLLYSHCQSVTDAPVVYSILGVSLSLMLLSSTLLFSWFLAVVSQLQSRFSRQPSRRRASPSPYPSYFNLFLSLLPTLNSTLPISIRLPLQHCSHSCIQFRTIQASFQTKRRDSREGKGRLCSFL